MKITNVSQRIEDIKGTLETNNKNMVKQNQRISGLDTNVQSELKDFHSKVQNDLEKTRVEVKGTLQEKGQILNGIKEQIGNLDSKITFRICN